MEELMQNGGKYDVRVMLPEMIAAGSAGIQM